MRIARTHVPVLVTGGAGFIGSHLVERLAGAGCRVTVLDNFVNGRRENLEAAERTGLVRVLEADVRDPAACAEAAQGADAVFHLACLGVRHSLRDPVETSEVNALGTLHVLRAALEAKARRFLYVSSSEVYGLARRFPLTEEDATWPTTVYGASKLAGEHYAAAFHLCHGLPVVRVRPFNNYGPRAHFEGDSGEVIPRFILRALAGLPPIVFGDGSQTRDFLYVADCAEALVAVAECDALVGDLVNLGYGREIRIGDLAGLVVSAVGRSGLPPLHEPARPGDVPRLWADASKLARATGFHPRTPPEKGLAETVAYYRKLHDADPELAGRIRTRNWEAP